MSRISGKYACQCGAGYHAPRSLVRHLEDTGHERNVPSGMIARRYPMKDSKALRTVKVTFQLTAKTAAYLHARAMREGTTFSEQVRCHIERGRGVVELEAAE